MAEGSEQTPPLVERVADGVTDVQFVATQVTQQLAEAGQQLVQALRLMRQQRIADSVAAAIRANPFVAIGAAFMLGMWVVRRR